MKKIINGKKYDTETAEFVGEMDNGLCGTDFDCIAESLYRKKTGEFFVYGQGGARTRYARKDGASICGGCEIVPLSEDEAKKWAERYLDADKYEEIFGEVAE